MSNFIINTITSLIGSVILLFIIFLKNKFGLRFTRRNPHSSKYFLYLIIAIYLFIIFSPIIFNEYIDLKIITVAYFYILPSIIIIYLLCSEITQFWKVGLKGVDKSISGGLNYKKALKLCKDQLEFLGTGASKLTSEEDFNDTLLRCRGDKPIKFLLLKPSDPILEDAARRAGRKIDEFENIVKESLRKLSKLKKERISNLEVRFYDCKPIYRLMFVDDSLCLLSYNIFGKGDGSHLPQLHITKAQNLRSIESTLYYPLKLYFDELWEKSEEWDFNEYINE